MRVLSARVRGVAVDRSSHRVSATVHLVLLVNGAERAVTVRTSAPIIAPGAARLKDRHHRPCFVFAASQAPGRSSRRALSSARGMLSGRWKR